MPTQQLTLQIPDELLQELQSAADQRGITTVELFRKFIKLGLLAVMIEDQQTSALIIRDDNGTERELFLV